MTTLHLKETELYHATNEQGEKIRWIIAKYVDKINIDGSSLTITVFDKVEPGVFDLLMTGDESIRTFDNMVYVCNKWCQVATILPNETVVYVDGLSPHDRKTCGPRHEGLHIPWFLVEAKNYFEK